MTSSKLPISNPRNWKKFLLLFVGGICTVIFVCALFGLYHTFTAVQHLRSFALSSSARSADRALYIARPVSSLTFERFPDIEAWKTTLELISATNATLQTTQEYIPASLSSDPNSSVLAQNFKSNLQHTTTLLKKFLTLYPQTSLIQKVAIDRLPASLKTYLSDQSSPQHVAQLEKYLTEGTFLTNHFLSDTHRYIILLQNSEELRPTGGFMGSYALLELHNGVITTFRVQDIYEPDGQFTGYVEPPPGVKEYLSEEKGFRLPDSNWNPDFPLAAPEITAFFERGKEENIDGIITVNLHLAEEVLRKIGPIYLPEYNQTVTAENLSSVARADRDQFFPGSQQKKNFLQTLLTHTKLRIQELSAAEQKDLLMTIFSQLQQKNVQVFSKNPDVQALSEKYHFAGQMISAESARSLTPNDFYLFLVEANVGINKTNKKVTREVKIESGEYRTNIVVTFTNNNATSAAIPTPSPILANQPTHNQYINYQRVFVLPETRIHNLELNGQKVSRWDEHLITTSQNQQLKQIGFLVEVPEQSEKQVVLELTHPAKTKPVFYIQKQSGLQPTPYTIQAQENIKTFLLEKDEVIVLP